MSLKIEYSSAYELFEIFKKFPEEKEKIYKTFAKAQKALDTANMEFEITQAELVDEICKSRKVPATAKQEVRRAEIQLNEKWKKAKLKVIGATAAVNIIKGRLNGMWDRGAVLEALGKLEMKMMYIDPVVYRDNRRPDTKASDILDNLDLPEDE